LDRAASAVFHSCFNVIGVAGGKSQQCNRKNRGKNCLGAPPSPRTCFCG
jgi:hypothetical protein